MKSRRSDTTVRRFVVTRSRSKLPRKPRHRRPTAFAGGVASGRGVGDGGSKFSSTQPDLDLFESGGNRSRSDRDSASEHIPHPHSRVQVDEERQTSPSRDLITAEPHQEELMNVVGGNNHQELIPGSNWFTKPHVVRSITSCFQQNYDYPYMNWTEVPKDVRELWFRTFKGMFTWQSELETQVRREFNHVCQRRLKDHVNKAASKPVPWMSKVIRSQLLERRQQPAFASRSKRNKENKVMGSEKVGGSIAPGHHQGSISAAELAQRLARENQGVLPSAADLFMRSHSRQEGSQRVLVTEKAKKTMAEYERLKAHYESQGIQKDPNQVFYEAVGGHKKGQVYGLGKSASLYYERSSSKTTRSSTLIITTTTPVQDSTEVQQLKTEMERMRNENAVLHDAIKRLEKKQAEKDTRDEEMWRFYKSISQNQSQCSHSFVPHPREPQDLSNGDELCSATPSI